MTFKRREFKLINVVALFIAGLINAIGVILFLSPANVLDGGISGLSVLLSKITPVSVAIFIIVINLPFFLLGYKKNGLVFIVYSLIAIASYSIFSFIFQYLNVDLKMTNQLQGDMFISAIFGGLISGIGSGMTIKFGGAIDGIEVLSVLFAKKLSLTVGQFVMVFNTIMYIIACFIFKNMQIGLYSIVTYAIGLKAVDFIVEGFDKAKACIIITDKSKEMGDSISKTMGRGITVLSAQGYYSGEGKTMLYCVVNRFEIGKITSIVSKTDPKAFMTINDISDIFGGTVKFKSLFSKKRKPTHEDINNRVLKSIEDSTLVQNDVVKSLLLHEDNNVLNSINNKLESTDIENDLNLK